MDLRYTQSEVQAIDNKVKSGIIKAELKKLKKQKNALNVWIWLLWFFGLGSGNAVIFLFCFAFSYPMCEQLHKITQKEKKIAKYFNHLLD